MPYTDNVPQATQRINDTQVLILQNFMNISTLIDVNHVTFGAAGEGKHKWIHFPRQTDVVGPPVTGPSTVGTDDLAVFAKLGTTGTQLFLRRSNIAVGGAAINFTELNAPNNNNGWTYLPSGLLLVWGRVPITNTETIPSAGAPYPTGFPGFTQIYNVQISVEGTAGDFNFRAILLDTIMANSFQIRVTRFDDGTIGSTANVRYLAIGI